MAMTLRLHRDDELALEALARAQGVSKHEAVLRAIKDCAARHTQAREVAEISTQARARYADILEMTR